MQTLWISTASAINVITHTGVTAETAIDQLLNALKAGSLSGKADLFFENKSQDNPERQSILPAEFWDHAQIRRRDLSHAWLPPWGVWKGRTSPNGSYVMGIAVLDADVRRLWPAEKSEALKLKAAGGRPPSEGWADVAIEATRLLYMEGVPNSQAAFVERLQTACGNVVGETQMKAFASRVYKAVQAIDKAEE